MCYETEDQIQESRERDLLTAFLLPKMQSLSAVHRREQGSATNSGLNLAQRWLLCWQSQQKGEPVEQTSVRRMVWEPRAKLKHSDKK